MLIVAGVAWKPHKETMRDPKPCVAMRKYKNHENIGQTDDVRPWEQSRVDLVPYN